MGFQVLDTYPVTDASVLPSYLRPYCEGKGIYWVARINEETEKKIGEHWGWGDYGGGHHWPRRWYDRWLGSTSSSGEICN
jgi:hypothetical protein